MIAKAELEAFVDFRCKPHGYQQPNRAPCRLGILLRKQFDRSVVFLSKHWIAIRKHASIRKFTEQPFRLASAWSESMEEKHYASTRWLRTAKRTSSLTQWQLSLRMRFVRCVSTVLVLRSSRAATSLLILPSANNCRISLSLAVST